MTPVNYIAVTPCKNEEKTIAKCVKSVLNQTIPPKAYVVINDGSTEFHCDGDIVGFSTTISDRRLKKDITPINNPVAKVENLTGCTFTRIDSGEKQTGLIAQDVAEVLPEAVVTGKDGIMAVAYGSLVGLLVEAIKDQQRQIDDLVSKVSE